MNCTEFGTFVVEMARGRPVDAALRTRADAHARECHGCGARLVDERTVTEQLAALRAATRDVAAPAALEGQLVAAFRATAPVVSAAVPVRSSAPAIRWWVRVAAGLVLLLGGALAGRWVASDRTGAPAGGPDRVAVAPSVPGDVPAAAPARDAAADAAVDARLTASEEPSRAVPERPAVRRRAAGRKPQEPGGAVRTEYASLPGALPRWSDAPLVPVRLRLPYGALPALGVQITREQWGETVPVEVLVGEDGIARGIRVVNNEVLDR